MLKVDDNTKESGMNEKRRVRTTCPECLCDKATVQIETLPNGYEIVGDIVTCSHCGRVLK